MNKIWMKAGDAGDYHFKRLTAKEITELTEAEIKQYYTDQNEHLNNAVAKYATEIAELKTQLSEEGKTAKDLAEINKKINDLSVDKIEKLMSAQYEQGKAVKKLLEGQSGRTKKASVLAEVEKFLVKLDPMTKIKEGKTGFESMAFKAPALMTIGTNVLPNVADGYSVDVNNYVDTEIASAPKVKLFILDLVSVETQSGTENIWWSERINEEGDAAFIAEGALKPLIDAEYKSNKTDVKEVALRWKMSNRMMMHTNRIIADFREHSDELIDLKIDGGVLAGDGLGDNLTGVTTSASAFIAPVGLANYYEDTNIWDVIHAIQTQIMLANFMPTDVVLNTVWMAKMKGIKNADGDYIVPPFVSQDGSTISGLKITFTNNVNFGEDDIIVGDLKKFKTVFAEDVMYAQGYENDDFSKNLTSNKLEAFLGTYLKGQHQAAIVFDNISTVTTAITVL